MQLNKKVFQGLVFIFFLLLGLAENCNSQTNDGNGKIVKIHPSIGNSINLSEKKEFQLFTEYNDSLFESAHLVKYTDSSYTILIKTTTGKSFEKPISIKELDAIYASIEKIRPAGTTPPADDKIEKKPTQEELEKQRKRENYYDSAQTIAEITFQIIYTLLLICAN